LHWLSIAHAHAAEIRLYDRLFKTTAPGAESGDFLADLNPDSCRTLNAWLEPSLQDARPEERFQFERHGYFAVDSDSRPTAPVFNRAVSLRDSWGKSG